MVQIDLTTTQSDLLIRIQREVLEQLVPRQVSSIIEKEVANVLKDDQCLRAKIRSEIAKVCEQFGNDIAFRGIRDYLKEELKPK